MKHNSRTKLVDVREESIIPYRHAHIPVVSDDLWQALQSADVSSQPDVDLLDNKLGIC